MAYENNSSYIGKHVTDAAKELYSDASILMDPDVYKIEASQVKGKQLGMAQFFNIRTYKTTHGKTMNSTTGGFQGNGSRTIKQVKVPFAYDTLTRELGAFTEASELPANECSIGSDMGNDFAADALPKVYLRFIAAAINAGRGVECANLTALYDVMNDLSIVTGRPCKTWANGGIRSKIMASGQALTPIDIKENFGLRGANSGLTDCSKFTVANIPVFKSSVAGSIGTDGSFAPTTANSLVKGAFYVEHGATKDWLVEATSNNAGVVYDLESSAGAGDGIAAPASSESCTAAATAAEFLPAFVTSGKNAIAYGSAASLVGVKDEIGSKNGLDIVVNHDQQGDGAGFFRFTWTYWAGIIDMNKVSVALYKK